jgi:uncharacterized protein (DUF488 family)
MMNPQTDSLPQFFTIGVFGSTESAFFDALESAGIDTFCDIRRRRGVRGSEYSFVNSTRLQAELGRRGFRYLHILDLAPPIEIREMQHAADEAAGIAKRKRTELSQTFISAYREACLTGFDAADFVRNLGPDARKVVLFCAEREPAACHRSLVAERLEEELGIRVTHLML